MTDGPTVAVDLGVTTVTATVDLDPPSPSSAPALDPTDLPPDLAAVFAPADGGALVVGAAARRLAPTDPERYEPTPRLRVDDPDLLLGTRVLGVPEAWGAVLAGALERAAPLLRGERPRRLVLTHPAGWDAGRREVLRRAGSGLATSLTLVAEPVAAAAYAAWMRPRDAVRGARPGPIAVLDLGARGAAASVLVPDPERCGGARLLAHRGDDRFGGDDADELLLGHLLSSVADESSVADPGARRDADRVREVAAATTLSDRRHRQVLHDDVRAAKEQLSDAEQAAVPLPGRVTAAWLSRGELTEILRPRLRRVVDLLAETLADAGTGPEHLDGVWLTGGGARMPLLAALVHRELGVPATVAPEPGSVVARGALLVAREDPASRQRAVGDRAVGDRAVGDRAVGGAAVAAPRTREPAPSGPMLDAPTVVLSPWPRAQRPRGQWPQGQWPRGEPGAVAERTDDLGDPVDARVWSTPTSSGVIPRAPAPPAPRRVRAGLGARGVGTGGAGVVVVGVVAVLAVVTGVVLGVRAVGGPTGTPTVVGGQVFVAPLGWVTAGGDPVARRVLLRPAGAPRGTELVAVQDNPLGGAAADPERARGQLAEQYEAARAAGDRVSGYEPRTEFGDRDVARYRQEPVPGVRVDWFVVLSSTSMISVGCRHGTDDTEAAQVLAACAQVVETIEATGSVS